MLSNLLYIFNVSCLVLDGVNEPFRQIGMLRILEVSVFDPWTNQKVESGSVIGHS